jgi:hypothetical protein
MNLLHAIRRALSMHPARREGERNARSTAELVEMIRHDALYGRRHDDVNCDARHLTDEPVSRIVSNTSNRGTP